MFFKWIGVLIRVPQRNRTCKTYTEIYYKELAQVIIKTDKSQDLQCELARQRPRRASSVVLVRRPKACKTQEGRIFQFKSKGRK